MCAWDLELQKPACAGAPVETSSTTQRPFCCSPRMNSYHALRVAVLIYSKVLFVRGKFPSSVSKSGVQGSPASEAECRHPTPHENSIINEISFEECVSLQKDRSAKPRNHSLCNVHHLAAVHLLHSSCSHGPGSFFQTTTGYVQ